jgi:hypothetical protein
MLKQLKSSLILLLLTIILLLNPVLAQPTKVIIKIQEGEKVLFGGTLIEEEIIQIPIEGNLLRIELTLQSYEKIEIYLGGDFIVKEVGGASLSVKSHRIILEKIPGTAIMSLYISMIPEASKTILAIYDEGGRPIAIFRKSPIASPMNASSLMNAREYISSFQNALDNSPLPEGVKAKYKESLYKSVLLLEEGRASEAERLVKEASEKFRIEETKFKRVSEEIEQVRKVLIEKISSSNLSSDRISKAVKLLNSAEDQLMRGNYDEAEILIAQISPIFYPSFLEQLNEYLPLFFSISLGILLIIALSYLISKRVHRVKITIPHQRREVEW